ncbi:uncharacterized protein [Nicotiana sylvestris]|uniref:Uncharacterized protein LOC104213249 n=1 Tax=Nicotiana sylvestris TaxID=4096 RepID=A0A1U7UYB0_NICSY|nr:PREDICTED: uncharacterized protein LOC104213249 [Nicotiana sylvestris]
MIASVEEKIGGVPYQMNNSIEFLSMDEDYGLVDLGFHGPRYTWSNRRGPCSIVWKRLDMEFDNDNWLALFYATTITHLAVAGSDYLPLFMEMHKTWEMEIAGHPIWIFNQKLKATSKELSKWSREQYGGIFQKPKEFEQKVKEVEEKWLTSNKLADKETLHEIQAQFVRHLKVEEAVLK